MLKAEGSSISFKASLGDYRLLDKFGSLLHFWIKGSSTAEVMSSWKDWEDVTRNQIVMMKGSSAIPK